MKKLLIIKTGAAGDVLRTTALLHLFKDWEIDWFIDEGNRELVLNSYVRHVFDKSGMVSAGKVYDLVIDLEDDAAVVGNLLQRLKFSRIFGARIDEGKRISYTPDSAAWFDLGLISRYGVRKADELKLRNRSSYQEILFRCLGHEFTGEEYIMPDQIPSSTLKGDIAIAPKAGERWPMKTWFYFEDLKRDLSKHYRVNTLPMRRTILEHIADIKQHRFVISPDSLPMHIALGLRIPCVAIFTCTSPWEIYDYGLLTKVISPKLDKYFYKREFNEEGVKCVPYQQVYDLLLEKLRSRNT
ncbi:MAG: glycosyltransferase family 9 protein [Bacteroidota bacterium]